MPRSKYVYTKRLTVKITKHMLADLSNVATKSGEPMSAIVRQAIRNYLDGTDLTLGTRRTFDRRFQKAMAEMEQNLNRKLEEGLKQIGQSVSQTLTVDRDRVEGRERRTVEESLASFRVRIAQMLDEREEKKGWMRR